VANVSWSGGSGVWDTATLWSTGTIPGVADAVTIDAAGSYTVTLNGTADVAGSILLNAAAATLAIDTTLALGTTLAAAAGTLSLGTGGVINGGTLDMAGATLVGLGGTLNGVTAVGPVALAEAGNFLTVTGGLHLHGTGGSGPPPARAFSPRAARRPWRRCVSVTASLRSTPDGSRACAGSVIGASICGAIRGRATFTRFVFARMRSAPPGRTPICCSAPTTRSSVAAR
jgi:hypothetical protein